MPVSQKSAFPFAIKDFLSGSKCLSEKSSLSEITGLYKTCNVLLGACCNVLYVFDKTRVDNPSVWPPVVQPIGCNWSYWLKASPGFHG